jgi:hypothetical protein
MKIYFFSCIELIYFKEKHGELPLVLLIKLKSLVSLPLEIDANRH